ncbi:MAG: glucose 1-dehydrogenase [Halobacteriales archaeon]|nr:glucose 1-dehydrogenase [Halobacteriales archaeon]
MTTDQFSVAGRTAIVTGGSSGIGRSIAERFAADGADVTVCSREQANVDPVAEAINDRDGGRALAVECDVREPDAVGAMVAATVDEFGGLDTLVNNAGASFMTEFGSMSENAWKTIVDINLHGTFHCCQAAGEPLREDGGVVVNMASVAGEFGAAYMSHYGAAKAAVINLTKSLAWEWAADDVRVNCIAPGFVATPGVAAQMGVEADEIDRETVDKRIGTVEEIADLTQFLASPASSYLVGETVSAAGKPRLETAPE